MRFKLTLAVVASFAAAPLAVADGRAPDQAARGLYVGVFGGGGVSTSTDVDQLGTAFFSEAEGGPMAINARGRIGSDSVAFIGAQIGHEWSNGSAVLPAVELEGFYLDTGTRHATLQNPTLRLPEHTFVDTFPMNGSVFLANLLFSFPSSFRGVTPYIGGGIGAARLSIDGAKSLQIDPLETGINHFDSGPNSQAWTFAAQLKAGGRIALGSNAYVFGEYRYLYVGAADQTFGPTTDITHVPTTAWTTRFGETSNHLATAGIGFNF